MSDKILMVDDEKEIARLGLAIAKEIVTLHGGTIKRIATIL